MKRLIVALVITLAVIAGSVTYAKVIANQDTPKVATAPIETIYDDENVTADELLTLINAERTKAGVAPLQLDERLNTSAQMKAEDMANDSYTGHVNPNTGKHGYEYAMASAPECTYVSENLTWGNNGWTSTNQAVDTWKSSEPHYKAMIDPRYETTGFGVDGWNVVEHFCDLN